MSTILQVNLSVIEYEYEYVLSTYSSTLGEKVPDVHEKKILYFSKNALKPAHCDAGESTLETSLHKSKNSRSYEQKKKILEISQISKIGSNRCMVSLIFVVEFVIRYQNNWTSDE